MNPLHPIEMTSQSLLSSAISDGDLITDWLYYVENIDCDKKEESRWLLEVLQLAFCVSGTISWVAFLSDGRLLTWFRSICCVLILLPFYFLLMLLVTTVLFMEFFIGIGSECALVRWTDWIEGNIVQPLLTKAQSQKASYSSGTLLIMGILLEDMPQLFITYFIELNKTSDDHPEKEDTDLAAFCNCLFSFFGLCHKVAHAWDLRYFKLNAFYHVKEEIQAHQRSLTSLTLVGCDGLLLSSSWWDDYATFGILLVAILQLDKDICLPEEEELLMLLLSDKKKL